MKTAGPGTPWAGHEFDNQDHAVKIEELVGKAGDNVYKFVVTSTYADGVYSNTLTCTENFSDNDLYRRITKDENWVSGTAHTSEEFKDNLGRTILKRTYEAENRLNTYYVYDSIGNLAYVIPPKAANDIISTQSTQQPYSYSQSWNISQILTNPSTNMPSSGTGNMVLSIQNSTLSISFSGSWGGFPAAENGSGAVESGGAGTGSGKSSAAPHPEPQASGKTKNGFPSWISFLYPLSRSTFVGPFLAHPWADFRPNPGPFFGLGHNLGQPIFWTGPHPGGDGISPHRGQVGHRQKLPRLCTVREE
ncbi:MAG: hypothetical protein EOP86_17520 [Verrucomicrobiaceae bacterium]|nr:MAG: hypothetical protein EOP86_17520 [Verrucomicrobiaceae bacterium]